MRERMGHTRIEILGGLVVGSLVAVVVNYIIVARF
jgi:acid phosphatase family membrane protein YuiD